MIQDVDSGKQRGYAFIEYEHERDMHCKYFSKTVDEFCSTTTQANQQRQIFGKF